ncbi:hypothetical protein VP01_1987g1 [Puccinia sorghi]|uniref:Uncharacterized protein n=1 Tax=Puccinia sorghi TaxID=27349 RepID=A0A0L6VC54_9BASI|nr:hypothetical protein VP01_1987g1 [Puccinia sorghi]
MRHLLRIALNILAAVSTCKAFDELADSLSGCQKELLHSYQWVQDHHRVQPAKSPNSLEHVIQSHRLSPSNLPLAHSFYSQQPGSVASLPTDHPNFNLSPADPSFHPGTDYGPNFQFDPGLHQDRGEPGAFAVSDQATWPLEDSSVQQAPLAHSDQEKPDRQESLDVEAWLAHFLALPTASLDFESILNDYPNILTAPATDDTPAKSPVPEYTSSSPPQPSGTFEPSRMSQPALGAFEHFHSHQNEHSQADCRLYNAVTPSLADVPSQFKRDYLQRVSGRSFGQGTFDNLAHNRNTDVVYPVLESSEFTFNSDKQHFQSHPLPSRFLPAPVTFDEPPRLNAVAWEGPHQSYQTESHNFAAYPNSVWSSHIPSHLSLHPVGTEPVRDPEPWPLEHSSGREASHNTDHHPTSRVPTASELTSNSNPQLSRSSDGVTALNSRTRRLKSPEPPVQLSAPLPSDPHSHGLPIKSFPKTYFEKPDAKLVIKFDSCSDDHLLFNDEEQFRLFCSQPLVTSQGFKPAGVKRQQHANSVEAFLRKREAWLAYWHRKTEVDPRDYLQRLTWGEAEPIFPLFLIYVELITAFLRKPNPKGYAEEFRQRCELFVEEANRIAQATPSSTASVEAQGPTNSSGTKKMKMFKCPLLWGPRPMRYVNLVWKLIFCWARDHRPTLLTTNHTGKSIIPKTLKAFINGVFVAGAERLTESTC